MFQIAVIVGWNTIRFARLLRSKLPVASILQSHTVLDLYNMVTLTLAGLMFYLQSGFARTFAPSILLVYLLLAARKDYKFLATLLTLNIAFFYFYVSTANIIKVDFGTEFTEKASLQSQFEKQVVFDRTTRNPWCNTLLIPLKYYDYRLTVFPAGIGISFLTEDWTIERPVNSKYLLFDQKTYEQLAARLNVELLESSSIGDLYYNLDSGCAANQ
jgi:hypothetical protein